MQATDKYARLPLAAILVDREARQRQVDLTIDDILPSVQRYGVLHPILIDRQNQLIAGERRLLASREAGLLDIPVRYIDELTPIEAQILELEENLKRKDMHWKDQVRSISNIHKLYLALDPDWSQTATAEALNITTGPLSQYLRVGRDLENPRIANAPGVSAAYNILSRIDERAMGDAMSTIMEAGTAMFPAATDAPLGTGPALEAITLPPVPKVLPPELSILEANFLDWAPRYEGQPFNLIHCDFPYGINAFAGPQSGTDKWTTYNDKKDIYWALVKCLCKNLDRLMARNGHLVHWLSVDNQIVNATLEMFSTLAPSLEFWPKLLIWHKSDNVGVIPDSKRGPRHVYEGALVASRDDRLIVRATSDLYAAPTNKDHHPSTKPEPMLRYFFGMFVDESTRLLDPTCGSGSALRAAESLGAKQVIGLEASPEHCANARSALRQFRALRSISK